MVNQTRKKNRLINILCVGPMHGFTTGQKEAFTSACQAFEEYEAAYVSLGGEGLGIPKKIAIAIRAAVVSFFWTIRMRRSLPERCPVAYITMSRSFFGLLREAPILVFLKIANIPIVNHLHGADIRINYRESKWLYRLFIRWCYDLPTCHIVLLPGMVEQLSDFNYSDIHVVPNCVSLPELRKGDVSETFFEGSGIRVLFLSNLIEEKGLVVAIDAVALAQADGIDIDFVVAGGGGDNRIRDRLSGDAIAGRARYVGALDRRRKWWALEEADILVFPSYYKTEAFPLVLIEAMIAGCAIICTDHNYLRDVVIRSGAILVPTQNPRAIADAIGSLYRDRKLLLEMQMTNRGAWKEYGFSQFKTKMKSIIEAVAQDR